MFFINSCSSLDDNFLEGKWKDGLGSTYVFDSKGDDGKYNPVIFQSSGLVKRFGKYKINGSEVVINWTNGNPNWNLEKQGSQLQLMLSGGRKGVTLSKK